MTVEELGEMLRGACEHANKYASVAASDPWWLTAAVLLKPRLDAAYMSEKLAALTRAPTGDNP